MQYQQKNRFDAFKLNTFFDALFEDFISFKRIQISFKKDLEIFFKKVAKR
jgi:hypothetical protein